MNCEALEERTVPATIYWSGGSGNWNDTSHWSTGTIPTLADDVNINNLYQNPVITIPSGVNAAARYVYTTERMNILGSLSLDLGIQSTTAAIVDVGSTGSLSLDSNAYANLYGGGTIAGSISTGGPSSIVQFAYLGYTVSGQLTGSGLYDIRSTVGLSGSSKSIEHVSIFGGILEGDADVEITDTLDWHYGTVRGTGTLELSSAAEGTIGDYPGSQSTLKDRTFQIDEGASVSLESDWILDGVATVLNQGLFTVVNSIEISDGPNGSGSIVNDGEFKLEGDSVVVQTAFDNQKTLEAKNYVEFWGFSQTEAEALLVMGSTGEVRVAHGQIGAGQVEDGLFVVDSTLDGSGTSSLTIGLGGSTSTSVNFKWLYFEADQNSQLEINILGLLTLNESTMHLRGTTNWPKGGIQLTNKSSVTNYANAHLTLENTSVGGDIRSQAFFTNYGKITKNSATSEFSEVTFTNASSGPNGGVHLQGGKMHFAQSLGHHYGSFELAGGAEVRVESSGHRLYNGATFTGAGNVILESQGKLFVLYGDSASISNLKLIDGNLTPAELNGRYDSDPPGIGGTLFITGQFLWQDGFIRNGITVVLNGTGTIEETLQGEVRKIDSYATFEIRGSTNWNSGDITVGVGTIHVNGISGQGVFSAQTDASIKKIVNEGLIYIGKLRSSNGGIIQRLGNFNQDTPLDIEVENAGGKVYLSGFYLKEGFVQTSGEARLGGAHVFVESPLFQEGFQIGGGTLYLEDGVLEVTDGLWIGPNGIVTGSGEIDANVENEGTIIVGGAGTIGTIWIVGNLLQSGTIKIDIDGNGVGQKDELQVLGDVTLGGNLEVEFGFNPGLEEPYTFLSFGTLSGSFATISDNLNYGLITPIVDGNMFGVFLQ